MIRESRGLQCAVRMMPSFASPVTFPVRSAAATFPLNALSAGARRSEGGESEIDISGTIS